MSGQGTRKRQIRGLATAILMVLTIVWVRNGHQQQIVSQRRASSSPSPLDTRPIMHTFYSRIPQEEYRNTGMSDEDDDRLLMEWKSQWREAGWKPKIIGLSTAQQHPFYNELMQSLDGLPFRYYDRLCFVRWLAMVQTGGGWMSDYDTFPLHDSTVDGVNLPNRGQLSVYSNHVPAAVSGTSDEYWRVLRLMLDNAVRHRSEKHWSDMLALADIYRESNGRAFHRHRDVLNGDKVLNGIPLWGNLECHMTRYKRAVHFSHKKAMRKGKLPEGFQGKAKERPLVARQWMEMWRRQCGQVRDAIVTKTTDDLAPAKKSPAEHVAAKYGNS